MNNKDLHNLIMENLDFERKWDEYLAENEYSWLEKWKLAWSGTKKFYKGLASPLIQGVVLTMALHGGMAACAPTQLPLFLQKTFLFLYLMFSFAILVPPFFGLWVNRGTTHRPGTYGKEEFQEVVCAGMASENIKQLLDIAIANSTTTARHRINITRMIREISTLKFASQRGGRGTVELIMRIKQITEILGERLSLLKDALDGYELQNVIQYSIDHPDCHRSKEKVATYFTEGVHITQLGYKKLDEAVSKIYDDYYHHRDVSLETIAVLENIARQFTFHNEKLLGGNLRKSA